MQVSSGEIARYRNNLDSVANKARDYMRQYITAFIALNPNASVSEIREATIGAIEDTLNVFGTQSATLAGGLFDEIVQAEGINAKSKIYETNDMYYPKRDVHYLAKHLVAGEVAEFTRKVSDVSTYYVKREAFENIRRNCDLNGVAYARVPTGLETCGFCFMLCSRGFVYSNKANAIGKHGMHKHCDCIVVPGKKGRTTIQGYDPDGMYDRWIKCSNAVDKSQYKDSEQELKAIIKECESRHPKWLWGGDERYVNARILKKNAFGSPEDVRREIEDIHINLAPLLRQAKGKDSQWYRNNVGEFVESFSNKGKIEIEDFTNCYAKELFVVQRLAQIGNNIKLRNPLEGLKQDNSADIFMSGSYWDIKKIESPSPKKIYKRGKEKRSKQGGNLVIDLSENSMNENRVAEQIIKLQKLPDINNITLFYEGKIFEYKKKG